MSTTDLEKVGSQSGRADTFTVDIEPAKPREETTVTIDYYEILRVSPQADNDTIERIYRTLADRFHPDNLSTGDPETFLRLGEAWETLSNPATRAKYNVLRQHTRSSARWLRGREFFEGVRGGQNRRLAVLCLLYRQRISSHESPGLSILDLEHLTGCTREELAYALWYLCEKKWAKIGEFTAYSVTADGFDVVESKLEDRLEFRALATVCYYTSPAKPEDPAHVEPHFWKPDLLPLDVGRARTTEEDVFIADHYEVLGVGTQAEEEDIERVYQTLAGRFHPDNPGTGDEKTFLRIREAYDTLSDPGKRAEYNALRQRTRYSARFRLQGREFFDGIKGEQLRRLAVLCLLYRQAASDAPGLTVLDLEQLTGCTREELGSALWYLREKKWTKSGQFTEYSITAAGFDVVENKLEDREAARSDTWLVHEDTHGNGFGDPRTTAVQAAAESHPNVVVAPQSPISRFAESEQTDIKTEAPSAEPVDIEAGPVPEEEATGVAEPVARFGVSIGEHEPEGAKSAGRLTQEDTGGDQFVCSLISAAQTVEQKQQSVPVTPRPPKSNAGTPEKQNSSWIAESGQLGIKAGEPPEENMEVAQGPISLEEVPDIKKQSAWLEDAPEPQELEAVVSWAWFCPEDHGSEFVVPHHAGAAYAGEQSQHNIPVTPEAPASAADAPEKQSSHWIAESARTDIKVTKPSDQDLAVVPRAAQPEGAPLRAEPAPQSQRNVPVTPQSPGVSVMRTPLQVVAEQAGRVAVRAEKRVIFSMGGKGGVGKTNVMTGLAEWFGESRIPVTLLDLDTENKAKGSLTHFFGGRVPKINIHTPAGLDAFVDILAEDAPAILADMGAGAGKITHEWFDKMYPDVAEVGIVFTAIGVVTSDPASVDSVLDWAAALQDRVAYVIVENSLTEQADFTYWRESDEAKEFRRRFQPSIIRMDCRLADLENAIRNYGVTLGRVAGRTAPQPELQKASLVMRAQSYRRRMFAEFDKVKELLLP